MSDIFDPIPSPDGMPEEQKSQDLPIDVNEPVSLPIDVFDEAPVKKAAKPAKPAAAGAPPSIPTPVEPAAPKSDADKKKKTWIIVGVVALLLICCCCVLPVIASASGMLDGFMQELEGYGSLLSLLAV